MKILKSFLFLATLGLSLVPGLTTIAQAQTAQLGCLQNTEMQTFVTSDRAKANIKLVKREVCKDKLTLHYQIHVSKSNIDSLISNLDLRGFGGNQIYISNTQNQSLEFVGIATNGAKIKETLSTTQIAKNTVQIRYRIKVSQGVDPQKLAQLVNRIYPLEVFASDDQSSKVEGLLEATNASQSTFSVQTVQSAITNVTQKVSVIIPKASLEYKEAFNAAVARVVNSDTVCNKNSTVLLDLNSSQASSNDLNVGATKNCTFNIQDVLVVK
jgi:hypothetical protein